MAKNSHTFRLSVLAEDRLAILKEKRGWDKTRCVEEALGVAVQLVLMEETAVNTLKSSNTVTNLQSGEEP